MRRDRLSHRRRMRMPLLLVLCAALASTVGATTATAGDDGPCPPGVSESLCPALVGLAEQRGAVEENVGDQGLANSLVVKVDAATKAVLALGFTQALNELDAFGHEVSADEKSGQISESTSTLLKNLNDVNKKMIQGLKA